MSDKLSGMTVPASQPGLAESLVAAIHENEAVLARVARLLHDDVSQVLSAVGLQLDAMRMDFREQTPGIDERAAEIQCMLEQAIEQLRDISNELNPSIVERAGLQFALERMAGKVCKSFHGSLRLHFDPAAHVPTALATTFYKIAEGAVDNALARPRCSLIDVKLKRLPSEFVLEVHDNGQLDEADLSTLTWGQLLMDYYAKKRQVALAVMTSPDGGTVVRASFPAPAEVPENAG
jgi:signal transduction histidine kinase